VERIRVELPRLERMIPSGVTLDVVHDRTGTIRASIHDVQFTLALSVGLVVLVVLLFLRTARATLIAGVALPLSLIATFGVMWLLGFSVDNLSLMALTIATGFVVDDAIVVIENITRHLEEDVPPVQAALLGAKEIGFTVLSITLSLVAVFLPILLMGGVVGRVFNAFAATVTLAVVASCIVSLTLTPLMASRLPAHTTALVMLSEVVFEDGFMDIPAMWAILKKSNPKLLPTHELITRDPLKVPVLTDKYWVTWPDRSGKYLADTLRLVNANSSKKPLPVISTLSADAQLQAEEDNNRRCFDWARTALA